MSTTGYALHAYAVVQGSECQKIHRLTSVDNACGFILRQLPGRAAKAALNESPFLSPCTHAGIRAL